jgi:hypothetical protein
MAHFAEIDENNIVMRVLVVDNSVEYRGQDFLANELGLGGRWIQTSYNNNFRKQYASIGYYYDELNDVFISPKPYPSWTLNDNFDWEAPVEKPGVDYYWNEDELCWIEIK